MRRGKISVYATNCGPRLYAIMTWGDVPTPDTGASGSRVLTLGRSLGSMTDAARARKH